MAVTIAEIREAAKTLDGIINATPVIADEKLSAAIGARAFLKAECLQRAGSFKIRGAYNTISQLSDDEISALSEAGATVVRLGPTVLRTSTAAAVALGALGALTSRW